MTGTNQHSSSSLHLHFNSFLVWQQCSSFQRQSAGSKGLSCSGIAKSSVLAGHLLYASSLALHSHVLCARSHDISRTNMVLWLGTCPARPSLCYTTAFLPSLPCISIRSNKGHSTRHGHSLSANEYIPHSPIRLHSLVSSHSPHTVS